MIFRKFPSLILLLAYLAAAAVWAATIYVAVDVSTVVLNTLHQIVELAQMS